MKPQAIKALFRRPKANIQQSTAIALPSSKTPAIEKCVDYGAEVRSCTCKPVFRERGPHGGFRSKLRVSERLARKWLTSKSRSGSRGCRRVDCVRCFHSTRT